MQPSPNLAHVVLVLGSLPNLRGLCRSTVCVCGPLVPPDWVYVCVYVCSPPLLVTFGGLADDGRNSIWELQMFFCQFLLSGPSPSLSLSLSLSFFLSFSLDVSLSFLDCSVENHHHTVANASLCVYNLPQTKNRGLLLSFHGTSCFISKTGPLDLPSYLLPRPDKIHDRIYHDGTQTKSTSLFLSDVCLCEWVRGGRRERKDGR